MIVVTGAAGFIGSAMVWQLNERGYNDIICVDKLRNENKWRNLQKRDIADIIDTDEFLGWLEQNGEKVDAIVHMGACSATTETDGDYLLNNNYRYTQSIYKLCAQYGISLIYASSAATYGSGEFGYSDEESNKHLKPLNKYGYSKQLFDLWEAKQTHKPKQVVGLKFFNVYGPNEYHKGSMASVIFHSFNQIKEKGSVALFKSYVEKYADGEQLRDFVYVKDVVNVIDFFIQHPEHSGIFNVGTGKARSFNDLVKATFSALELPANINYIEMPEAIRDKYQYYTQATMNKLKSIGYTKEFTSLEDGAKDYVCNYLNKEDCYL